MDEPPGSMDEPPGSMDEPPAGAAEPPAGTDEPAGDTAEPAAAPARSTVAPTKAAKPAKPAKAGTASAKPARPAKSGAAKGGGVKAARPAAKTARPGAKGARPAAKGGKAAARPGKAAAKAPPPAGLVVGDIPPLARVAGGLAVAGALFRLVVPAAPLAHGTGAAADLGRGNAWDFLVLLPLVALVAAAGASAALGRLPRLGLAVLLAVGSVAVGASLRTIYLFDGAARSSQDLPLGIGSSFHYRSGGGLVLLLVADLLLVAAFVAAAVSWSRTVMEDEGRFDGLRARFAAAGLIVGVVGGLAVGMAAGDASIPGAAAPPVLEQEGLAELGGLVIAIAVAGWGAFAPTLRPRLATVGIFTGLAVLLGTEALERCLLAKRSPVVEVSAGAVIEFVAAAALAALALGAWRMSAKPAVRDEISGT
jgi:hypothetical protein